MDASVELACVGLLLVYLAWVPLPFGSNVEGAFLPLVLPPLVICAVAAAVRMRAPHRFSFPAPFRIWLSGGAAFVAVIILQLIPLPPAVMAVTSAERAGIWNRALQVASLGGTAAPVDAARPLSLDPPATLHELFRVLALIAVFVAAALLVHNRRRRLAFALALSGSAIFQALYGVHEAALRRYAIWGWPNSLIFNRVTGTFVNPNHFGHYLAIVLPLAVYLGASAWHRAGASTDSAGTHMATLVEKHFPVFAVSILASLACVGAIMLSQSRGAMLAVVGAFSVSAAILYTTREPVSRPVRRGRRKRARIRHSVVVAIVTGAVAVAATVGIGVFLGRERTIDRFQDRSFSERGGRRAEIGTAVQLWRRFPVLGAGAGTFESVVSMVQRTELGSIYQHAHDDYAEIAATTGILGFTAACGSFAVGMFLLLRAMLAGNVRVSWSGNAFTLAAVTSLAVASMHALFDFNFFIPANAATIAAIAGAGVAIQVTDPKTRLEGSAAAHRE